MDKSSRELSNTDTDTHKTENEYGIKRKWNSFNEIIIAI